MRTLSFPTKRIDHDSNFDSKSPEAAPKLLSHQSLTDAAIRKAGPKAKPYRKGDGDGLVLLVQPTGAKWWRFEYRLAGVRKGISLGVYPEISLAVARDRRREAREQVALGIDPSLVRRREQQRARVGADETFGGIAAEWLSAQRARFAPATIEKLTWLIELMAPVIGRRPIRSLEPTDLLDALRPIEDRRRHDSAHRARTLCSQIFRYAIATGRATRDQSADLRGALRPIVRAHHAALTHPKAVGALLRAIDGFDGSVPVQCALKLLPLTFVRPGELRAATWEEIDLTGAVWRIPAGRMKMRVEHLVPLSRQAVTVLTAVKRVTGRSRYVFPSIRSPKVPMSENTLNAALRRLGYTKDEATAHGFRAMARTMLDERLRIPPDVIEAQLAHRPRGSLGDTYARAKFIEERTTMMQAWADYLDTLKAAKP